MGFRGERSIHQDEFRSNFLSRRKDFIQKELTYGKEMVEQMLENKNLIKPESLTKLIQPVVILVVLLLYIN